MKTILGYTFEEALSVGEQIYGDPMWNVQMVLNDLEWMWENALEEAKRMNAKEILLDSPPPFKPSHQLYEKYGFKIFQEYPEVAIPAELKVEWVYMKKTL